jgi:hypothetical protein
MEIERKAMIERWLAERIEEVKTNGRTQPLVTTCSPEDPPEDEDAPLPRKKFLVKALGASPDVHAQGLFNELFGSMLACLLGLKTAPPALIVIDQPFIDAHRPLLVANNMNLQPGLAVGLDYVDPIHPYFPDYELTVPRHIRQAADIYAFDMLIDNSDRRTEKPNCGWRNGELFPFDFDLSFQFLQLLVVLKQPWEIDDKMSRAHLFYGNLKNKRGLFTDFCNRLAGVSGGIMEEWVRTMPGTWTTNAAKVLDYIRLVRSHAPDFEKSLEMSIQ